MVPLLLVVQLLDLGPLPEVLSILDALHRINVWIAVVVARCSDLSLRIQGHLPPLRMQRLVSLLLLGLFDAVGFEQVDASVGLGWLSLRAAKFGEVDLL